jgi:hypothetical protein
MLLFRGQQLTDSELITFSLASAPHACRSPSLLALTEDPGVLMSKHQRNIKAIYAGYQRLLATPPYRSANLNESLVRTIIVQWHDTSAAVIKPTAVLVNTARGELVDEAALSTALRDGKLAAAGLDVVAATDISNPLLGLDNVILAPHAAYHSRESRVRCADSVLNTVEAFVQRSSPKTALAE